MTGTIGEPGVGEHVEPEVAAAFGALVGLLNEDGINREGDPVMVKKGVDGAGARRICLWRRASGESGQCCCYADPQHPTNAGMSTRAVSR